MASTASPVAMWLPGVGSGGTGVGKGETCAAGIEAVAATGGVQSVVRPTPSPTTKPSSPEVGPPYPTIGCLPTVYVLAAVAAAAAAATADAGAGCEGEGDGTSDSVSEAPALASLFSFLQPQGRSIGRFS